MLEVMCFGKERGGSGALGEHCARVSTTAERKGHAEQVTLGELALEALGEEISQGRVRARQMEEGVTVSCGEGAGVVDLVGPCNSFPDGVEANGGLEGGGLNPAQQCLSIPLAALRRGIKGP